MKPKYGPMVSTTDDYIAHQPGGLRTLLTAMVTRARSAVASSAPRHMTDADWEVKVAAERAAKDQVDREYIVAKHPECSVCDRPLAGAYWVVTDVPVGDNPYDDPRRGVHMACQPRPQLSPTEAALKRRERFDARLRALSEAYGRPLSPQEQADAWQEIKAEY